MDKDDDNDIASEFLTPAGSDNDENKSNNENYNKYSEKKNSELLSNQINEKPKSSNEDTNHLGKEKRDKSDEKTASYNEHKLENERTKFIDEDDRHQSRKNKRYNNIQVEIINQNDRSKLSNYENKSIDDEYRNNDDNEDEKRYHRWKTYIRNNESESNQTDYESYLEIEENQFGSDDNSYHRKKRHNSNSDLISGGSSNNFLDDDNVDEVDHPNPDECRLDIDDGLDMDSKVPNLYAAKKTVAQGMMDIALITANANQLHFMIEFNRSSSTFHLIVGLISVSLILQVVIGISLIFKGRMDIRGHSKHENATRINNYVVVGVFLVTIINVFIASFAMNGTKISTTSVNGKND